MANSPSITPPGMDMYFDEDVASAFAELEQNEKHEAVAHIVESILLKDLEHRADPLHLAELGGGAHPDRYPHLFGRLLKHAESRIDWVDISPIMLRLASEYLTRAKLDDRRSAIRFIEQDAIAYLDAQPTESLDGVILKYTLEYFQDVQPLFEQLSTKLKPGATCVATYGFSSAEIKGRSTNARYSMNGEDIPPEEKRSLNHGDRIGVQFYKVSGDPTQGDLENAYLEKVFHDAEELKNIARDCGLEITIKDWRDVLDEHPSHIPTIDQAIIHLYRPS